MVNLTANTKNYRQITLNTKPHSDPPTRLVEFSRIKRQYEKAIMKFKIINGLTPSYLSDMFTSTSSLSDYGLRSSKMNIELPKNRISYLKNSFAFKGAKFWNNLPNYLKEEKAPQVSQTPQVS